MTTDENIDTPRAIEVAPAIEPPSWHGPVADLTGRVTKLEVAAVATNKKLDTIEAKTDTQTIMLGEIKGFVFGAAKTVAENPWARRLFFAILFGLAGALVTWLGRHGIEVKFAP